MKSAPAPPLFLRACRIHLDRGSHSPCGRDVEGISPKRTTIRGTVRLERMPLRDKSLKPSGSATVHDDSAMTSLRSSQLSYSFIAPCYAFCYGSVPANPEIRLIRVTTYNQRPNRSLGGRCGSALLWLALESQDASDSLFRGSRPPVEPRPLPRPAAAATQRPSPAPWPRCAS